MQLPDRMPWEHCAVFLFCLRCIVLIYFMRKYEYNEYLRTFSKATAYFMEKYQAKIDRYSTNWCVIFKASELRELRNGWERLWERETYSVTAKHKPRLSKEFLTLKESWRNLKETLKLNGRCRPIRVPDFDSCSKIEKCFCFQNVYILSSCRKSKNKLATHCLSCVRNLGEPVKTEPWYWGLGVESSP